MPVGTASEQERTGNEALLEVTTLLSMRSEHLPVSVEEWLGSDVEGTLARARLADLATVVPYLEEAYRLAASEEMAGTRSRPRTRGLQ